MSNSVDRDFKDSFVLTDTVYNSGKCGLSRVSHEPRVSLEGFSQEITMNDLLGTPNLWFGKFGFDPLSRRIMHIHFPISNEGFDHIQENKLLEFGANVIKGIFESHFPRKENAVKLNIATYFYGKGLLICGKADFIVNGYNQIHDDNEASSSNEGENKVSRSLLNSLYYMQATHKLPDWDSASTEKLHDVTPYSSLSTIAKEVLYCKVTAGMNALSSFTVGSSAK